MLIRKRKLTQNQSRRIEKTVSQIEESHLATGVIVSHFGKQLAVQISELPTTSQENDIHRLAIGALIRCHSRTNLPLLATGDKVLISYDAISELGRIEKLLMRQTLISRPDRYHKLKPVASNIDLLVVVFAPLPKPAANLIDRYLLIAHLSQVPVLLVCNKSDLADPETHQLCQEYITLGLTVIFTSILEPKSIDALKTALKDKLALFAGQSGVGKSSLINLILPNAKQSTNAISELSKLGQHTTTTSRLLAYDDKELSQGGIIDTPGIREYGVWHLTKDEVFSAFFDILPYKGDCQFRDCQHSANSKGCALWQAVKDGKILQRRLESLLELQAQAGSLSI